MQKYLSFKKVTISLFFIIVCILFTMNGRLIHAEQIPQQIPKTNIIDHSQTLTKQTAEKIKQWNDYYQTKPIRAQIRICVFTELDDNSMQEIETNMHTNWETKNDHPYNSIYFIIDLKNKKMQTEVTNRLNKIISQKNIASWHQTTMTAMRQDDINVAIQNYLEATYNTLQPYQEKTINQPNKNHNQLTQKVCIGF